MVSKSSPNTVGWDWGGGNMMGCLKPDVLIHTWKQICFDTHVAVNLSVLILGR